MAVYEFENRSRQIIRLPIYAKNPNASKGRVSQIWQSGKTIVIGDAADRDIPDGQRSKLTPSPIVRLTDEQLEAMGERNRKALESYVRQGDVLRRQVA